MLRTFGWLALALAVMGLSGCLTADPREEISSASTMVESRSGIRPDWSAPPAMEELPATLDVATAAQIALERHPTLGAELAAVGRARADLADADRLPNPKLRFGVGIVIDGGGGSPLSAGLLAPLTALWTRPAEIAAADASLRAAVLDLSARAFETIEEVELACLAIHHAARHVEIDGAIVGAHGERVALIEELVLAGEATRERLDGTRIDLARARTHEATSREKLRLAERRLLERLGAIDRTGSAPTIEPESLEVALSPTPDEGELIELVATRRLDVAAVVERARAQGARLRRTRGRRFGDVNAGVGFEQNFSDREAVFPGLELEIPLFDTGASRIAGAEADVERAVRIAEAALSAAWLEVRSSQTRLTGALERLDAIESEWLPAARERAELARLRHLAGEANRVELLAASIAALEAEGEQNAALLAARSARVSLVRTAGGSLAPLTAEERDRLSEDRTLALEDAHQTEEERP